jgi:hypothetical protein
MARVHKTDPQTEILEISVAALKADSQNWLAASQVLEAWGTIALSGGQAPDLSGADRIRLDTALRGGEVIELWREVASEFAERTPRRREEMYHNCLEKLIGAAAAAYAARELLADAFFDASDPVLFAGYALQRATRLMPEKARREARRATAWVAPEHRGEMPWEDEAPEVW